MSLYIVYIELYIYSSVYIYIYSYTYVYIRFKKMYNDDQYVTNGIPWRSRNQMLPGNLADARHLTSKTWYLAYHLAIFQNSSVQANIIQDDQVSRSEIWKDSMTSMTSLHHYTTVIIMHVGAFIHSLFPNLSYRFNIMTQYIYIYII